MTNATTSKGWDMSGTNAELIEAVESLTRQAMGSGIAWFAENAGTMDRSVSITDALGSWPPVFLSIRRDLTDAIAETLSITVTAAEDERRIETAEAECARLLGIIEEARNFDGAQTVNGVTDEGWMSPNEWLLGKIDDILAQATPEEAAK